MKKLLLKIAKLVSWQLQKSSKQVDEVKLSFSYSIRAKEKSWSENENQEESKNLKVKSLEIS